MKKKKDKTVSLPKDELQKQLKRKDSAMERMKRGLKIEAALEQVRERAMAMHKSDELHEVVKVVLDKLNDLEIGSDGRITIAIVTFIEDKKDLNFWIASPEFPTTVNTFVPYNKHPIVSDLWKARESGISYFSKAYGFKQTNSWWEWALVHTNNKNLPDDRKKLLLKTKSYAHAIAFAKYSGIYIHLDLKKLPSEKDSEVLVRFAKVFDQAYIRFLDLQKAEAQTREAQIEAALEKVRSRSLAVHQSDEFKEVVNVVFEKLQDLEVPVGAAGINIFIEGSKDSDAYVCGINEEGLVTSHFRLPYFDNIIANDLINAHENSLDFFSRTYAFEEKNIYWEYQLNNSDLKYLPGDIKSMILQSNSYTISMALAKHSMIVINDFEGKLLSEKEKGILKRFAKVFEQAYIRFLDLQKAEVQTREAQIESALERVRSRSLGMHKSDELKEVVKVVFKNLEDLEFAIDGAAFIGTPIEDSKDINIWIGDNHAEYPTCFRTPFYEVPSILDIWNARVSGLDFYYRTYNTEEKNLWFKYAFENTDYRFLPDQLKNWILEQEFLTQSFAIAKNSMIGIHYHTKKNLTDNEIDILKRFSKVFDQSYIRFLDLQKAEAQAREAKIQLSLERVRAKTMAMHNSDDVADAVASMFDELLTLGIEKQVRCGIGIIEESMEMEVWTAYEGADEKVGLIIGRVDMSSHQMLRGVFHSWKNKETHTSYMLSGEDEKDYYRAINNLPEYPAAFDINSLPAKQYQNAFYFREGFIYVFSPEKQLTDEAIQIFTRFANAFGLTYRRFLDLQKAEVQAREAQIELSLERVRAKTMAMHNSQHVADTVATLFDELVKLGVETIRCGIGIMHEPMQMEVWTAKKSENEKVELIVGRLDMMIHPLLQGMFNGWKNKETNFSYELIGDDLIKYFTALINSPEYPIKYDIASLPQRQFHNDFYFPEGALFAFSAEQLSTENSKIFKRFAGVFGQTYRRYLDLQKAEAQARHAQIEASMEKVRARSLAMQKPDELIEVAEVLRKEMGSLGVEELETSSIYIVDEINGTAECWYAIKDVRNEDKKLVSDHMIINLHDTWVGREMEHFYSSNEKQISILMQGGNRKEWINYCAADSKVLKGYYGDEIPERTYHLVKFSNGYMGAASPGNISAESWDLLQRATNVFSFAYTRFQDLQNATAREREAQTELALERVRARTMAMFKSDELAETAVVMLKQLIGLGIAPNRLYIAIINDDSGDLEFWMTDENGDKISSKHLVNINKNISIKKMYEAWAAKKKIITIDMQGNELEEWLTYWKEQFHVAFKPGAALKRRVQNIAFFSKGFIAIASPDEQSETTVSLLERFAAVFNITYTRFSDLQQAEAQTRESQIQLAMERVRARTMAMQRSDELAEAASLLFKQIADLGTKQWSSGFDIWSANEVSAVAWMSNPDGSMGKPFTVPYTEDTFFKQIYEAKQTGNDFFVMESGGKELEDTYQYLFNLPEAKKHFDGIESLGFQMPTFQITHCAFFSQGYLMFITYEPVPEMWDVFKRFAKVFEQTYTRFLDLQKSEAQAREAQIEAGLERVRSRAMAMHKTDELLDAAELVYKELSALGVASMSINYAFVDDEEKNASYYSLNPVDGKIPPFPFIFPHTETDVMRSILAGWKKQGPFNLIELDEEATLEHQTYIGEIVQRVMGEHNIPFSVDAFLAVSPKKAVIYTFNFSKGYLFIIGSTRLTKPQEEMVLRFTKVFEMTYRRFLDLKKAEAQAREATIEAALEKVRGKAMAMHNSNDLSVTASMVFTELRKLDINPIRCGVALLNKESRKAQLYSATSSSEGDSLALIGWLTLSGHTVFEKQYDSWLNKANYFPVLKGEELKSYYKILSAGYVRPDFDSQNDQEEYGHFFMFSDGFLFAWSERTYSETEIKILERFKNIIELTFRRYIELKKSETNARDAVKQAALDRVRADIASMRTTNDLEKITPLIWNELTILGIPFIRCGVFIMDGSQELIHTFLSTPDGNAIAAFHIPYDTPGNINQVLNHWKQKENYIDHWDELSFKEFADTLVKQGALASSEQYLQTIPHGGFHLHFLPFLQGMLYVGNSKRLDDEEIKLIQSVADAFSTAYARYEDFNKLEAAKQTVEKTLVDLKQAQTQLIQSEKMASLGELTAGIAHEIQNPLNFVNNFSEVSNELIDEMNEELDKGEIEEAKAIAQDIKQNLEKINHHGKRADGIVKGMLQHSRSSSGQKELTDINVLTDEYLRLCYHGLRAKDKSFNSTIKTDFDHAIEKINIIPQDIGRVILNLLTNAFYAVNEKKKLNIEGYEPTVSVSTKKSDNQISISVSDNGNGILQKAIDKIFQPFFTTKPTGQGTGLGLSLSYDIIKAHGGEIKVETKEGEGSIFIIQLPVHS